MLLLKSDDYVNSPLRVRVLHRNPQEDYPEHGHDFSELILVSAGSGTHVINGEPAVMLPNTVTCVSDSDFHQYSDNKNLSLINVLYDKRYLNLSQLATGVISRMEGRESNALVTAESFSSLLTISEMIKREQSDNEAHTERMVQLLFEQLLLTFDRVSLKSGDYSPVMNAVIFLCDNYTDHNLSVAGICEKFNVTYKALNNRLNNMCGMTVNRFINHLRMTKAQKLLQSGLSVTETAFRVGYSDSNYFSTKFKSATGKVPKDYKLKGG